MMRLLNFLEQSVFIDKLKKLRRQLDAFQSIDLLGLLELFENKLTLDEMEACFPDSTPDEINDHLKSFLSTRWERVRNTNMSYTQQPNNLVNQLCFEIAKAIAAPAATESEIAALAHNTGPYFLLMPSLENSEDIYGQNIHSLGLHEFVLSDDERVFIPLAQCLQQASISDEVNLRQVVAIDGEYPELTVNEIERVSKHSMQAAKWYHSVIRFNTQRLRVDNISSKLSQLARALKGGSSGQEFNAGNEATLGIVAFSKYWEALPERERLTIFSEEPSLKELFGGLFRPNDVNYRAARYCIIAAALEPIIQRYNNKLVAIQRMHDDVLNNKREFEAAASADGLELIPIETPPKYILDSLFSLEPEKILKYESAEGVLIFFLLNDSVALSEIELDAILKQQVISARFTVDENSALLIAVKSGKVDVVNILLSWGAKVNARNRNNKNAFDIALELHSKLIEPLLMHIATLPLEEQAGCFACVPGGPYKTALLYAFYHQPSLVNVIINKTLEQPNKAWHNQIFNQTDKWGEALLVLAAKLGANRVIDQLLTSGVEIDECTKNRALIWTIINCHDQALQYFLDKGVSIEIKDGDGNTALNIAAMRCNTAAAGLLLKHNADVNARNSKKQNVFDIEIERNTSLTPMLLMHIATWPLEQQAKCLASCFGGRFKTALLCAFRLPRHPNFYLVDDIIDKILTQSDEAFHHQIFNETDDQGNSPLLWAAKEHSSVVELLLAKGLSIESYNFMGNTPLHIAVRHREIGTIVLLLKHNANVNARDNTGMNAFDIALFRYPSIRYELLSHIARLPLEQQAECLARVSHGEYESVYSYIAVEMPSLYNEFMKRLKESNCTHDLSVILDEMKLDQHRDTIYEYYQQMMQRSVYNSRYRDATSATKTLLMHFVKAEVTLYQSDETTDNKIRNYKESCKEAIKTARLVLEKHRKWRKVLGAASVAIITAPVSVPLYAAGFFTLKTKPNQLLDNLQETINKVYPQGS